MEQLTSRGYDCHLVSDFFADVDIIIRADVNLPCEVKLARAGLQSLGRGRGRRLRWQWDCSRLPTGIDSVVVLVVALCWLVWLKLARADGQK
jgi:hypothetical protein